jgi:hypothetical protein
MPPVCTAARTTRSHHGASVPQTLIRPRRHYTYRPCPVISTPTAYNFESRQSCSDIKFTVANNAVIISTGKGSYFTNTNQRKLGTCILLTGHIFKNNALSTNLSGLSNLCSNRGCSVTLTEETTRPHDGVAQRTSYGISICRICAGNIDQHFLVTH